jgi:hypothetical protein
MRHHLILCAAAAVSLALFVRADDPRPEIRLVTPKAGEPPVIEVAGVGKDAAARLRDAKLTVADWRAVLRVVVDGGTAEEIAARPPLAGSFTAADGAIRFEPQFPLTPGLGYRVTFDGSKVPGGDPQAKPVTGTVSIPKPPPGPPPAIAAIYPSADRLPENTLRLYLQFSAPMARGNVYRHLKLIRDDGTEVFSPFLELDEELWAADGTRLTVFFHPGRVKKGLQPREELGPILEEGHTYTLVIDRKWENDQGQPLPAEVRKTFTAGPEDERPVDPQQWTMIPPRANADTPLILRLAKPLDHALLGRMIWVTDAAGKRVDGVVTVGGGERVVTFAPARPWARGDYKLVVDTRLEDVCGNRVGEPFEVDVFRPITKKVEQKTAERAFTVR